MSIWKHRPFCMSKFPTLIEIYAISSRPVLQIDIFAILDLIYRNTAEVDKLTNLRCRGRGRDTVLSAATRITLKNPRRMFCLMPANLVNSLVIYWTIQLFISLKLLLELILHIIVPWSFSLLLGLRSHDFQKLMVLQRILEVICYLRLLLLLDSLILACICLTASV